MLSISYLDTQPHLTFFLSKILNLVKLDLEARLQFTALWQESSCYMTIKIIELLNSSLFTEKKNEYELVLSFEFKERLSLKIQNTHLSGCQDLKKDKINNFSAEISRGRFPRNSLSIFSCGKFHRLLLKTTNHLAKQVQNTFFWRCQTVFDYYDAVFVYCGKG